MNKYYIAGIGSVGLAAAYYFVAQQGSPENAHPETLTRDYIDTALVNTENACRAGTLNSDTAKQACAESVFETSTKFFIHWRNSMAQSLYDSVWGTIIGDGVIGMSVAQADMACRFNTKPVTDAKSLTEVINAVADYNRQCTGTIAQQIIEIDSLRSAPFFIVSSWGKDVNHSFKPDDFVRLQSFTNNMSNSL